MLSFACVFFVVAFLWEEFRKQKRYEVHGLTNSTGYSELMRTNSAYKVISTCFIAMIVCYVTVPSLYHFFIPISSLDNPLVNNIGLLVLNISLVLMVIAQLDIDREFYRLLETTGNNGSKELLLYSKRKFFVGVFMMYVGVALTISTVIGFVFVIIAFTIYRKNLHTIDFQA